MKGKEHSVEDYKRAFKAVWEKHKIHDNQREMLQYHFTNRNLTATQLGEHVGYKSYNAVNLHYGKLARWVCEELGYVPFDSSDGKTYWTFGLADEAPKKAGKEWVWRMYDNLATAIKELGIVK